jgi:hypothetical protein
VKRLKDLELENSRLPKAVSDLTPDKLILQEAARGNFAIYVLLLLAAPELPPNIARKSFY